MKAALLKNAGGSDMLELTDIPEPELTGPEHIRVRLRAAGINPVDIKMRQAGTFFPEKLPAILGCDGAGEVEAVGDEVYFFNGGIGGSRAITPSIPLSTRILPPESLKTCP